MVKNINEEIFKGLKEINRLYGIYDNVYVPTYSTSKPTNMNITDIKIGEYKDWEKPDFVDKVSSKMVEIFLNNFYNKSTTTKQNKNSCNDFKKHTLKKYNYVKVGQLNDEYANIVNIFNLYIAKLLEHFASFVFCGSIPQLKDNNILNLDINKLIDFQINDFFKKFLSNGNLRIKDKSDPRLNNSVSKYKKKLFKLFTDTLEFEDNIQFIKDKKDIYCCLSDYFNRYLKKTLDFNRYKINKVGEGKKKEFQSYTDAEKYKEKLYTIDEDYYDPDIRRKSNIDISIWFVNFFKRINLTLGALIFIINDIPYIINKDVLANYITNDYCRQLKSKECLEPCQSKKSLFITKCNYPDLNN